MYIGIVRRVNIRKGSKNMSKNFLFFSAQYLPTVGGVERFTNHLARRLIQDGHHVMIATSSLKSLPSHETDADGIEIFRFPSWPFMNGRLPLLRLNRQFRRLASQLWGSPIDYCVINTYFYPLSMYAAVQARRRKLPALILNHGSAWLMTSNKLLELAGQLYERCAATLCHHNCRHFYGVSDAANQWLRTFSIAAEGNITNAIDPDNIIQSRNIDIDWRVKLGLPENAKLIVFVGRMIPEKGVAQLIAAMPSIRQTHPDAFLVMAGDGILLEKYLHAAPNGVFLLGSQAYPDVLALLSQGDLFCLPSRSEGFACTVLEAAALGCPIVTTATGGSPQLLVSPAYGILLPDMSSESISKACIQALKDPNWRKTASQLAKARLCSEFTWDTSVTQLYRAFGLLENHPGSPG